MCLYIVLRHTLTVLVHVTNGNSHVVITQLGRERVQLYCLGKILRSTSAFMVQGAEYVQSCGKHVQLNQRPP